MPSLLRSSVFPLATLAATAAIASVAACGGSTDSSPASPTSNEAGADRPPPKRPPSRADAGRAPTWCDRAGTHAFCDDFDDDDGLGAFDEIVGGDDPAHRDESGIVPSDRSAPNALHLRGDALETPEAGANPTGPFSGLFGVKGLPKTTSTKARVSFDLRVAVDEDYVSVLELTGRTKTDDYAFHVSLDLTPEHTYLGAATGTLPPLSPIPTGRWVHVEIAMDAAAHTATLSFDGTAAGSSPFDGSFADSADTKIYVGVARTAPSGAYDVAYDDLVVDFD